ncbi:MAG: ATP-binding protein [Cytophagales bacterium]|nr:ATP-binding protein [Cytophagales bacterium]
MEKNVALAMVKKVVLFGPESTGKTFLAEGLAKHFQSSWVPEFARGYLETKKEIYDPNAQTAEEICQYPDILPIAIGQIVSENTQIQNTNKVLFCDTNFLQTIVYSKHYFQKTEAWLEQLRTTRPYDLYLLTDVDVPWMEDPLRDRPDRREYMFELFKNELIQSKCAYKIIHGDFNQRMASAIKIVEEFLNGK